MRHGDEEESLFRQAMKARLTRREALKIGIGAAGSMAFADGLGRLADAAVMPPASGAAVTMSYLVDQAKKEGKLNTIALPRDWANYGELLDGFTKKYGIPIENASPLISSAEELQAIRLLKGQDRAPDVVDVGPAFAVTGQQEGLFAPYKVTHWSTIPDNMKEPTGLWFGDYFGVIAFGLNRNIVKTVPQTWADLKKPEYKGQVALNNDPRRAQAAFSAVWSAALANKGSLDDITPGVDFFAELKKLGNFIPVTAHPAEILRGETPISADWDYLQLGYNKEFAAKIKWEVVVLHDGIFGGYYCQAVSATAPHPFAARLWLEYLYSDEGQIAWLKGFAHPARFTDLVKRNAVPKDLLAQLPPAQSYNNVQFPTQDQNKKAQKIVAEQWGPKVIGQ